MKFILTFFLFFLKRLSGQKLKNLRTDLKEQDKDEITLKRLRAEGQDKDGLREADVRRKLNIILRKYGLEDDLRFHPNFQKVGDDSEADAFDKQIFKDKKLDKLWKKAEMSGFSEEQLKVLKEEFKHHQEKINEYHQMIRDHEDLKERNNDNEMENHLDINLNHFDQSDVKKSNSAASREQALKEKHQEVKKSFDAIKVKVREKTVGEDFEEENVQKLWNLAQRSDFTLEELESLKEEFKHYQTRIKKLKYFQDQLHTDQLQGKNTFNQLDEKKGMSHLQSKVKELNYKVNKIHLDLESRILKRHVEL